MSIESKMGWLINDRLTAIPNTRTFWHDLLDWFPNLIDKCNGYTDFTKLPKIMEATKPYPDFIVRNGSYFRKLNINVPTFSLIQDTLNQPMQTEVINSSTCVVFASKQTYKLYKDRINPRNVRIIEQSSDFNFFKPIDDRHPEVLPNSIIFIGDSSYKKKGFHRVLHLIELMTDFNFCLVMKDNTTLDIIPFKNRSRVRIFNKVNTNTVRLLINSSVCGICTSENEEGHFSGIEIGACNIPMVARPMGCYLDRKEDKTWGLIANDEDFPETIRYVLRNRYLFSPRKYYSKEYTLERCHEKWRDMLNEYVV